VFSKLLIQINIPITDSKEVDEFESKNFGRKFLPKNCFYEGGLYLLEVNRSD
jgi:hypothetical protein